MNICGLTTIRISNSIFLWDGGDQQIPLYLVEKDGSVYNFMVVVKANAETSATPSEVADLPVKKSVDKKKGKGVGAEADQAAQAPASPDQTTQDLENTVAKSQVTSPPPVKSAKTKPTRARDRVFRSLPFEVEARLSAEGYNSNITVMGGASFSGWLSTGKQFILQTPRLGFDIDYDRNITSLQDQFGNNIQFYRLVADIKYNISSGGTNRDNLYGPIVAYENFSFGSQATNAMGLGAYWSHPIYSGVDSGLNYLKWFRHPKWLDLQGQYYLKAIDTTSLAGPTFNLAARMKIYFRPTIFYDFGLNYSTADFKTSQSAEVITSIFTATLGLGANF